ncbi:MAG TPA: YtcA family lipoprotein [Candidatus Paceibacterota bacterium]|jgi:hypothetical protein|nr:YtcA family lipoprotein [Candidatus Paceibacterota bacterium]
MKTLLIVGAIASCIVCSGCSRAPSVSIIGSFFPVWMICIASGVVATFVERVVLVRLGLEQHVGPLWLFYPASVTLYACVLWEVLFR